MMEDLVMIGSEALRKVTSVAGIAADKPAVAAKPTKQLSAAAVAAADAPTVRAWSPIVLAGFVRVAEFALIMAVGFAIHVAYIVPIEGFEWRYVGAIVGIAVLAMLAFQSADIYQVQAFRGYEKQYFRLASAWSVVFLLVISATFFAKIGDHYSRLWLGSFYAAGLVLLVVFRRAVFLLIRHWTQQGRLDRRTVVVGADERGDALIRSLAIQRDSDVRVLGVFDDRSEERTLPNIRQKLGTVDDLVEFARRTRIDLVILHCQSRPRTASCKCSRNSGCCRSISGLPPIPTSCAFDRARIPISAACLCSTCSTSRSPTGTA
jgi:hypothetical protein